MRRIVSALDTDEREAAVRQSGEAMFVARLAAGDREAPLEQLYDAYGGRLYALGLHLFGDPKLADDLVRETFVRVRRSADGFDVRRTSVRTFVFTLARRAAADLWRGPDVPTVLDEPDTEDAAGTDAYEQLLVRLDVGDALASLSVAQREVLELLAGGDLTHAQVAARLRVPLGTVRTRTLHALRALARRLQERDLVG